MSVAQLGMGWFPDQPGGSNRYFRELFEGLRSRGHVVSAVVVGPVRGEHKEVVVASDAGDWLPGDC